MIELVDEPIAMPRPFGSIHDRLIQRAVSWLRGTMGCRIVFAEMATAAPIIPDAIGWSGRWSILVECKATRSDFCADFRGRRRKSIHATPSHWPGQERWFFAPKGLIRADEVPGEWGLAEVERFRVLKTKAPARSRLASTFGVERWRNEMDILLSAVRRHQLGVEWQSRTARFQTLAERRS